MDLTHLVRSNTNNTNIIDSQNSTPEQEHELYKNNNEQGIPSSVNNLAEFSEQNNLSISFHRKPLTKGCSQAVEERSKSLNLSIPLSQELKTMALETKDGGLVAIHIPANYELPRENSGKIDYQKISKITGIEITGRAKNLIQGRINPITLHLEHQNCLHFFLIPDGTAKQKMYTNAGMNTWGIEIPNILQLMEKIGAKKEEGIALELPQQLIGIPQITPTIKRTI